MADAVAPETPLIRTEWPATLAQHGFVWLCLLVLAAPVAVDLVTEVWTTEQGAQGPLILVTGLSLLWLRLSESPGARISGRLAVAMPLLLASLALYVLARIVNMLSAELLAIWAAAVVLLYASYGAAVLQRLWFPLIYLLFLIPAPVVLVGPLVQELKLWISASAVNLVADLGVEAASRGSSLFVDQYELQVAAACSGLNSLITLLALGIFYVHVRHGDHWRRAALLSLAIVPVALGANLIRVLVLLIAVHFWGENVLETPLHMATGLAMAAVAMALLFAIDVASAPLAARWEARRGR